VGVAIVKKIPKRVQTKPLTFQDWWEKQDFGVEHFKPCRAAWQAARAATSVPEGQAK
jgi:hypothetical protein